MGIEKTLMERIPEVSEVGTRLHLSEDEQVAVSVLVVASACFVCLGMVQPLLCNIVLSACHSVSHALLLDTGCVRDARSGQLA
eukprot:2084357-Amphidinium_carterae.1